MKQQDPDNGKAISESEFVPVTPKNEVKKNETSIKPRKTNLGTARRTIDKQTVKRKLFLDTNREYGPSTSEHKKLACLSVTERFPGSKENLAVTAGGVIGLLFVILILKTREAVIDFLRKVWERFFR
jgi:hypothetical protein